MQAEAGHDGTVQELVQSVKIEEGEDYVTPEFPSFLRNTQEGRPVKDVALSRDGFKHLAMMAQTSKRGKTTRMGCLPTSAKTYLQLGLSFLRAVAQ